MKAMPQNPDQIPFFVLGNKVDKPPNEIQVPGDTVEAYLRQNPDVIYFETSALDGSNVQEAFSRIAQNFLKM